MLDIDRRNGDEPITLLTRVEAILKLERVEAALFNSIYSNIVGNPVHEFAMGHPAIATVRAAKKRAERALAVLIGATLNDDISTTRYSVWPLTEEASESRRFAAGA